MKLEFSSKQEFIKNISSLEFKGAYTEADLLVDRFRLYHDNNVDIYYTPFDYINERAKIVFIGITPGWTQMELAFRIFRSGLENGKDLYQICIDLERNACFAGSMKINLIKMLNELGFQDHLGTGTSASFFAEHQDLIHTTSVIRYATFVKGKNYTGHQPVFLQHHQMRSFVDLVLMPELKQVPDALIIPLGKAVSETLQYLVSCGHVDANRCLLGFPHPSGANGHRKRIFEKRKAEFRDIVQSWFNGSANQRLQATVESAAR